MPGHKRRYLSSPNPIQHIHAEAIADSDVAPSHVAEDTAPVAVIVDGVTTLVSDDAIVKDESFARHMTTDGGAVADKPAPAPGCSDFLCEGVSAGAAASAAMNAAHAFPSSAVPSAVDEPRSPPATAGVVVSSNQRSLVPGEAVAVPPSPVSNRDRFIKGFLPARTCCNLDLIRASAGTKFNLAAICIAVFPKSSNPDRRYIQLADVTGSVGVTVWNENVNRFSRDSVGRLVTLTKIVITNHNGKKALSMARDSSVQQVDDDAHNVSMWWKSLLTTAPLSCGSVHDVSDNTMVSVCGILGFVSAETKMVQGVPKTLLTLHLVDSSGRLDVRSWNHNADTFNHLTNAPILIRRVRVTSFANVKLGELLDGSGSVIEKAFPGDVALRKFWSE